MRRFLRFVWDCTASMVMIMFFTFGLMFFILVLANFLMKLLEIAGLI